LDARLASARLRHYGRRMRAFFAVSLASSLALGLAVACTPPVAPPKEPAPTTASSGSASSAPSDTLESTDLVEGTGPAVRKGSAISVEYTGKLTDGTVFDSSKDAGKSFSFIVGNGTVIRGWELGVIGMKKGGKRKLVIPPRLGYGEAGSPPKIPGHATLIFEIELVHIVE